MSLRDSWFSGDTESYIESTPAGCDKEGTQAPHGGGSEGSTQPCLGRARGGNQGT